MIKRLALTLLLLLLTVPAWAGYNGTGHGTITYGTGAISQALDLSSDSAGGTASKWVTLPEPANYDFAAGTSWTVEGFFYPTAYSGTQIVAINYSEGAAAVNWYLALNNTGVAFISVAGFTGFTGSPALALNTWHDFAIVCTSGTSISFYVDGSLRGSAVSGTYAPASGPTITLGSNHDQTLAFQGLLDEFSFSNTAQYTGSSFTPSTPFSSARAGQVALYHFDNSLFDSNGGAGTLTAGTVTPGTPTGSTIPATWTAATGGTGPYTYQLQGAPDAAGAPGVYANAGSASSALSGTATGLSGHRKYWLRVAATDSAGTPATVNYAAVFATTPAGALTGTTYTRTFAAPYGPYAASLGLGFTIFDGFGGTLVTHTTAGVTEYSGGIYATSLSFDTSQSGVIVWDAPPGSAAWSESFSSATTGTTLNVTGGGTKRRQQ